jgi:hypothetical protein
MLLLIGLESENSRVIVCCGDVEKIVCEKGERGRSQTRAPTTTTFCLHGLTIADSYRAEQGGLRSRYQLHVDARHQKHRMFDLVPAA